MENYNEHSVNQIIETYKTSMASIGIDVMANRELLVVLAQMADIISELRTEVFDLKKEMHNVSHGYTYRPSENRDE